LGRFVVVTKGSSIETQLAHSLRLSKEGDLRLDATRTCVALAPSAAIRETLRSVLPVVIVVEPKKCYAKRCQMLWDQ